MLISPSEPVALKAIGTVSSIPEQYGADIIIPSAIHGLVGVQRKEISDLVSSVQVENRLGRELLKMKQLEMRVLIIEGILQWTNDGKLLNIRGTWTKPQHLGLVLSLQQSGYSILSTSCLSETIESLLLLKKWTEKKRHNSINHRPKPTSQWGRLSNEDWAKHLLQSFEGVGPVQAQAIYDEFGGVPIAWTCMREDLEMVKGLGKKTAARLFDALS